jgi:hypothetical protein|tara:strand:+ start:820 stop:1044 length:225 start_codon:yes stop_codon:yes gene_type:complete
MPQYTLINKKTEEQWEVTCSWNELQDYLTDDVKQGLSVPKIISGRSGAVKVPAGFTDLKNRVKKGSGKGNTINV